MPCLPACMVACLTPACLPARLLCMPSRLPTCLLALHRPACPPVRPLSPHPLVKMGSPTLLACLAACPPACLPVCLRAARAFPLAHPSRAATLCGRCHLIRTAGFSNQANQGKPRSLSLSPNQPCFRPWKVLLCLFFLLIAGKRAGRQAS